MLRVTRQLLDQLAVDESPSFDDRDAAVTVIRRRGSHADATAILDRFLDAPEPRSWLLPILWQLGDATTATQLFNACIDGDRLREGMPHGVLHCLGHLGHRGIDVILWHHATDADHYVARDACLGLVDQPCRELAPAIARELERHEGTPLFPEFLPLLAAKTGDPSWIERLVRWGTRASTDCNGGLVLGLALFGDAARASFQQVIWDPHWEATGEGTGTARYTYLGTRVLGLELRTLVATARAIATPDALGVLVTLASVWAAKPWLPISAAHDPSETASDIARLLFAWSTPHHDDSLTGLARQLVPDRDARIHATLHELHAELRVRMRYELELSLYVRS